VFDVLAPDGYTSVLPEGLRLVLHVNPSSMQFSYSKVIERIQTEGGFVEQHWGDAPTQMNFSAATGGFKRVYSGLSNTTGGGLNIGGTRRETLAYDKFLSLLSLFHSNGDIYDDRGELAIRGSLKVTFDGGIYIGRFQTFVVTEDATKPFQFQLSASFNVEREITRIRSQPYQRQEKSVRDGSSPAFISTPRGTI
jgi:hypothetical protein